MAASIWTGTLGSFRDDVAAPAPAPAGVAASMVTGALGVGLLVKVLDITRKRKDFCGDPLHLSELLDAARQCSLQLSKGADEDVAAVLRYMDAARLPMTTNAQRDERCLALYAAMRDAVEVPMRGSRIAVAALDLSVDAAMLVKSLLAADLAAAATLLCGAVRAMLLCVDFNLQHLRSDEDRYRECMSERKELEERAVRQTTAVRDRVMRGLQDP